MKKMRGYALANGIAIGFGIGCFFAAAMDRLSTHFMDELLAIYEMPPLTTELKSFFFIPIIMGIIFLAAGIGIEAYQRARIKPEDK